MRNHSSDALMDFALAHPWSLTPEAMTVVAGVMARGFALGTDSEMERVALVNRKTLQQPKAGSLAIIPVHGVIAPRPNWFTEIFGGSTYQQLGQQLTEAMSLPAIKTIILDIDSPGGSVAGNAEFATQVMKARAVKPVVAQVQFLAGSAAYHIASAATAIYAAPSALVGSIGTYMMHDDITAALDAMGIKRTFISAGKGKLLGNPSVPLDDAGTARLTAMVDEAYAQFVDNVVRGRGAGTTAAKVRNEWQAHLYGAADALALGMIDKVVTLEETLARLLAASPEAVDREATTHLSAGNTDQEPAGTSATSQDCPSPAELQRQLLELSL
jgi:signal peptide peptidase SppA